jgi:hypothetical protein
MRVDCGQLDPDAVIRPEPGEWHPRMPARLDEEELADWRAGRNAIHQFAALTIGTRLAVADISGVLENRRRKSLLENSRFAVDRVETTPRLTSIR